MWILLRYNIFCAYLFLKLDSWPRTVQTKFNFTIYPITFPKENAKEWKKLFKPCASQRLFLPVGLQSSFMHITCNNYTFAKCPHEFFVVCFPADPKGGGFFALCGHRYPFSAAGRGHLGPPFSVQFEPLSCHGSRARGATHRLVQPFCPPPLLWQDRHQLRGHAHEHDPPQGEIF